MVSENLEQLVGERRYYEALIAVSPTAIITAGIDMVVRTWNPAAEILFGYSAAEAIGRHIDDLVANAEELRSDAEAVNATLRQGTTVQAVVRRTRKDARLVDVALRSAPISVGGEQVGFYVFYDDVSELVRQRRHYESLVAGIPVAVITLDRDARVLSWNPAAEELFGYSASEAIGVHIDDLVAVSPEVRQEAERFTGEAWKATLHENVQRTRRDGTLIDVELFALPVKHQDTVIGYYVIYHDIGELQESRRRLQQRVDEQMAELVRTGELARFLPRQIAEGLLAGHLGPDVSSGRRRITVLFADMVGFTDLAESLEPEELSEVLNEYLREMTAAVLEFGGTLDNFIGDGIMALFGAPQQMADHDQADSAVRAAIEMRRRCQDLAARLRDRGIPSDLHIRIGLNTGHCTVGVFGSDVMRAYKAVGFGVNVAQRLQAAASPDSILCGFRTYALLKDRVKAIAHEALVVKGATRPVEVWEIVELIGER